VLPSDIAFSPREKLSPIYSIEDHLILRQLPGRIRALRKRCGITQGQLGEMAKVTSTCISNYERGAYSPTIHALQRIANALGVRLTQLIDPQEEVSRK
jgi:transcriptional regulator with XRE-family HTH domain